MPKPNPMLALKCHDCSKFAECLADAQAKDQLFDPDFCGSRQCEDFDHELSCIPCPECGAPAEIIENKVSTLRWTTTYHGKSPFRKDLFTVEFYCRCSECDMRSAAYREVEPAIRAWNNQQRYYSI